MWNVRGSMLRRRDGSVNISFRKGWTSTGDGVGRADAKTLWTEVGMDAGFGLFLRFGGISCRIELRF